jgi:hypothetical protein
MNKRKRENKTKYSLQEIWMRDGIIFVHSFTFIFFVLKSSSALLFQIININNSFIKLLVDGIRVSTFDLKITMGNLYIRGIRTDCIIYLDTHLKLYTACKFLFRKINLGSEKCTIRAS